MSALLFHIDKQINKVLIQGRFLPKKVNQWAMEARTLKSQVSDLLKKQQNTKQDSLNNENLVEMGIKMINHLKKCPCKDGMMYDKPIPVIIRRQELGSDKPSGRSMVHRYQTGGDLSEGKMDFTQQEIEQYLDPVESSGVQDQEARMMLTSAGISSPAVELQKKSDVVNLVEKSGDGKEIHMEQHDDPKRKVLWPREDNDNLRNYVMKPGAHRSSTVFRELGNIVYLWILDYGFLMELNIIINYLYHATM